MKVKWTFYLASVLFCGYFLLAKGAPPAAVAAGIVGAGVVTFLQRKRTI